MSDDVHMNQRLLCSLLPIICMSQRKSELLVHYLLTAYSLWTPAGLFVCGTVLMGTAHVLVGTACEVREMYSTSHLDDGIEWFTGNPLHA